MELLNKIINNNVEILFAVTILEAIIIIFLVVYFVSKIKEIEDKRNKDSQLSEHNAKNHNEDNYWRDEYNKVLKELSQYKKGEKISSTKYNAHLSQVENKQNVIIKNETEGTNQSYNDLADYARKEIEKGIYVKETTNGDGTVKSEIDFDLTNDEPITIHRKYEYLEAANGGQFRKLLPSDEKSFFRTWEENGVRRFEFHGNVDNALANFNAVFDDVCVIEGKQNGATQIINLEPGVLTSQLKVNTPAKIKLI